MALKSLARKLVELQSHFLHALIYSATCRELNANWHEKRQDRTAEISETLQETVVHSLAPSCALSTNLQPRNLQVGCGAISHEKELGWGQPWAHIGWICLAEKVYMTLVGTSANSWKSWWTRWWWTERVGSDMFQQIWHLSLFSGIGSRWSITVYGLWWDW